MTRIPVADDDEDIRGLIELSLTRIGHDVRVVRNGAEAWVTLQREHFDLVVLDSMMPGLSGAEVTGLIRASTEWRGLKVLMLSARASETEIQTGYDAGVDLYVTKPFSPRELQRQIASMLDFTRGQAHGEGAA